jgi:hypothetical protein
MFVIGQSGQVTSLRGKAPSDFFCGHFYKLPRNMTQQSHLASGALKRGAAVKGKRALRVLSIAGWFCRLPSLEYGTDSVAPDVCLLARAAARALLAVIRVGVQNDSTRATTPGGPTGVGTVEQ